jgi:Zn-dependent protease
MDANQLIDGLLWWLGLVVLLTFHEFGHAWMALRCGDDTAQQEGRVSLNPLVHIDPIGTVLVPLIMLFMSAHSPGSGAFLLGWARPVPVNIHNLNRPRTDDMLVTFAGPFMNFILGVVLIGLARVASGSTMVSDAALDMAHLSLFLCVFNLIPIPPLDGSQILRAVTNMSYENYREFARYGFLILFVVVQIPLVQEVLQTVTNHLFISICRALGVGGW